jgi:sialic acid synthase SpsE
MKIKNIIKLKDQKIISNDGPCFIIAEAGVNHNGQIKIAKQLVDIAVYARADAIKFQTFLTNEIILQKSPKAKYHLETTGSNNKLSWYNLLKSQEMSLEMHKEIISYCKKKKIIFMSTPYDTQSVDLLEDLGVSIYKVASTDLNNHQLIEYISKKKKPIILSTAMSSFDEVKESCNILKKNISGSFVLMQCTGSYPAPINESNLAVINTYKNFFKCLVGFSDHVEGNEAAKIATSIGISVYEKHITVNKNLPGPDHRVSMEKVEFKNLIDEIRKIEKIKGAGLKFLTSSEKRNRNKLRKYFVAKKEILMGQKLTNNNITCKRTGGKGISADKFKKILGLRVKNKIDKNQIITKKNL